MVKRYGTQKTYYVCVLLLCCLFLWQGTVIAAMRPFGFGVSSGAERAASFFLKNNLSGPIFNNFDIGSYLIYRLYPKEHVFIDGRPEAYPKEFIQNVYIPMQQSQENFHHAEELYKFRTIFFSHTDQTPWANQFLKDILTNDSWKIVYLDDTVIILVKNTQANEALINRFAMNSDTIKISHLDTNNRQSLVRLASFFNKIGLTDYELQMYQHLLTIDPADCLALYNSGILLQQKNDPGAQIFAARYQQACQK